jgi:hypothetical protein
MERLAKRRSRDPVFKRAEPGKSQSSASEQQIDDEYDQQNAADPEAAAISPPVIAETAPEEEDQYYNNQDQVHSLLPLRFPLSRFGAASRSTITPYRIVPSQSIA